MELDAAWLSVVRRCFEEERVLYSGHARREMLEEEFGRILDSEVHEAVCSGEVIETYPTDSPYPSALILGSTAAGRPIHVVCAHDDADDRAVVITVYEPDPHRWEKYRRRKQ